MSYSITLDLKKNSNAASFKLLLFRLFNLLSFSSLMFMPKISSTGLMLEVVKYVNQRRKKSYDPCLFDDFPANNSYFMYQTKSLKIKNLEDEEQKLISLLKSKYNLNDDQIFILFLLNNKSEGIIDSKYNISIGVLCSNKAIAEEYVSKEHGTKYEFINNFFLTDQYPYTDFKNFEKTISKTFGKIEKKKKKQRKFFFCLTIGTEGKRVFGTLNDGFSNTNIDEITKNES